MSGQHSRRAIPPHTRLRRDAGSAGSNMVVAAGLVCLVVLGNHGRQYNVLQTSYASRRDCLEDWGDEDSCRAANPGGSSTYYGPRYYWDPKRGRPVVIDRDGSERIATSARVGPVPSSRGATANVGSFARGGFGGIGRGFSSGRGG